MWLLLLACGSRDEGSPPVETSAAGETDTGPTGDTSPEETDTGGAHAGDTGTPVEGTGGSGGPLGAGSATVGTSSYSYYAPPCVHDGPPVPVLYTFHGSGGRGADMVGLWRSLADSACVLVVGLDSESQRSWNFSGDVDNFARLLDAVDAQYDIRWRYLHGYSAGAHWTYIIGLANSDLFDGIGVYAGSLRYAEEWGYWPDAADRPLPVAIAHGTADTTVPYTEAEHAYDELSAAGWPVDLYTLDGATHAYDVSCQARAWDFWTASR